MAETPSKAFDRDYDDEGVGADDGARMSFLEHLEELRKRILYSLYAVGVACAGTFWFHTRMYSYLTRYLQEQGGTLIFTQPMGGFMFDLKITVLAGLVVAAPFVFSQVWLFIAPGLYARERRVVIPFVVCASALFFGGAYFAHAVAYPTMWGFFASYGGETIQFMPDLASTFSFYVKVVLGMGLIFQMPVLVFFMARFGVITAGFMLRKFKYAVLLIVVIASIITPTGDAISLAVFVLPMLVLYGVSILVAWAFGKKKLKAEESAG